MSTDQQQPQAPAPKPRGEEPHRDFARKGALAAIGGAVSGTARALWTHVLGDDS